MRRFRLFLFLLLFAAAAFAQSPTIGNVTVTPSLITPNTAVPVTFTAQIASPGLIANGANLLRVNAAGAALPCSESCTMMASMATPSPATRSIRSKSR